MDYSHKEMEKTFNILTGDVSKAHKAMLAHDNQYNRRMYIRTAFAMIEGIVYETKIHAIEFAKFRGMEFSPAELSLLKEESYELSNRGKPQVRIKYLKLADNLRFVFSCFAKAFGSDFKLNVKGEGWECFKKAIEFRHRITHPKLGKDLDISDEELQTVEKAMDWFRVSSLELWQAFGTWKLAGRPRYKKALH